MAVMLAVREPPRRQAGFRMTVFALTSTLLPFAYSAAKPAALSMPVALALHALLFLGGLLSLWGIVSLGRSFGISPATRTTVSDGPYAYANHPIYVGYMMTEVAFVALFPSPWNFLVFVASMIGYCIRGQSESRMLEGCRAVAYVET